MSMRARAGALLFAVLPATAAEIHVSPGGDDAAPGTAARPKATLAAAQSAARRAAGREPVTVWLHGGVYYLPVTLRFLPGDSGAADAPVVYSAVAGERPVVSGGIRLSLDWRPFTNGIFQAKTPAGLRIDQLFVNGQRQHMARYPDHDASVRIFGGTAADAIAAGRVAGWANPLNGYIHAMHAALWGDMHWRILGKNPDGSLAYEGGWQNNRPSAMHKDFRFVENIREELDASGEWFHDGEKNTLYYSAPAGARLNDAAIEAVGLRHLIEFEGTPGRPVRFLTLRGLIFRHSARTFMENREPLLRSDWTIYRGGALVLKGAEDVVIEDCDFDQSGGNAVFVDGYNRRIAVRGCHMMECGANGVAFVGRPGAVRQPLFEYRAAVDYARMDRIPGPKTDDYPADCVVEDCLIERTGRFEKQTAGVQISMARSITVRHCSIYGVPRAGINIGDGCWGGHVIEGCDVFDTVLETGDHGSFNSWGRDRYWRSNVRRVETDVATDPALPFLDAVSANIIRRSRWRCDRGWDIDLDDGSSNYQIYDNLLLNGGLKLREGYRRIATNNIILNNSLHPHVWFENSGDVFARNIVMGAYRPARMDVAKWGDDVNRNLFMAAAADRARFVENGCDADSLVGDALFVDPAAGDFRVREGSPALGLGFVNFSMDGFGVRPSRLKAIARSPIIPQIRTGAVGTKITSAEVRWRGATLRELLHYEFSAVGLPMDARGVFVADAPTDTNAKDQGLRNADFIVGVNGRSVSGINDFMRAVTNHPSHAGLQLKIVRDQGEMTLELPKP